jgi:hypothetical protein
VLLASPMRTRSTSGQVSANIGSWLGTKLGCPSLTFKGDLFIGRDATNGVAGVQKRVPCTDYITSASTGVSDLLSEHQVKLCLLCIRGLAKWNKRLYKLDSKEEENIHGI